MTTIPLCVPVWEERLAFKAGAEYSEDKGFYIPESLLDDDDIWEWLPLKWKYPNTPALVPDMLPVSTWENNVRNTVPPERWDILRRYCYRAAGHQCEICGSKGLPHIECHEVWKFDKQSKMQILDKLIALCPLCHKAKHIGFAKSFGILPAVKKQIGQVNDWTPEQVDYAIKKCQARCAELSQETWGLDTSWLIKYNVKG